MSEYEITAKIIADSINEEGVRITTFELEYWRAVHAEFMTHRQFSRNAASSRAIPFKKNLEILEKRYAQPIHWGKNQQGMKAREEIQHVMHAKDLWKRALDKAIDSAKELDSIGLHKQIVNRILEPFTPIKVICTATEYDNFFWLRNHPDAQPEIQELARVMKEAYDKSQPVKLQPGEWHLPYIGMYRDTFGILHYHTIEEDTWVELSVEEALKISSSCCAQVSYRNADTTIEKAIKIYDALVTSEPPHFSPFEHQAMAPKSDDFDLTGGEGTLLENMPEGFTHKDRLGRMWSGNFRGWVQYRQLLMADMNIEAMTSKKV